MFYSIEIVEKSLDLLNGVEKECPFFNHVYGRGFSKSLFFSSACR
jgi:hypothetical protein